MKMIPTGETQGGCAACIWWTPDEDPPTTIGWGYCHFLPPSGESFPFTPETDYCKEWDPREGEGWRHHEVKPEETKE